MSDTEFDDDLDASYEADNPDATKEISLNETAVTETSLVEDSFDLESASFASEPGSTSTPTKTKPTRSKRRQAHSKSIQTKTSEFKAPKPPAAIIGRCPVCHQGLKTMPGLNNHILAHKWKDLAAKQPNLNELNAYCLQECRSNILQKIAADRAGGKFGAAFGDFVDKLLKKQESSEWETFSKVICDEVCENFGIQHEKGKKKPTGKAFASGLRHQVQQNISKVLSDKEKRDEFLDALFKVDIAIVEVVYPFLMIFMQKVGNTALLFTFRSMTGRLETQEGERKKRSKDDFDSRKAHKLVHYVSGSCVRSHFRHASRHPRNKKLQMIKNTIMNRFVVAPPTVAEKKDKAYWTKTLNRRSLFFVNENAFHFFLDVAKLLQQMELKDGSIGHEAVMDRVVNSPEILFKWDMIVGSTLEEDHSFSFMVKVIRTLTNTYGVGVLRRRMNEMWKKGKGNKGSISVSHRARVLK